jgi:alpha-beta hydrolase superfamily lysophospholipase
MRKTSLASAAVLVAGAAVLACGRPYVPLRSAQFESSRTPPDVDYARDKFVTDDGLELYEQRWSPPRAPRATVVLVHGLKDHSTRYREVAISLTNHGLAVHAFDMRGHGYSAGVRDHVGSADQCLADLDRVVNRVRLRSPDKPVFLLGQGFGGTLVGLYGVRSKSKLAGLILSAPALRGTVSRAERARNAMASAFAPRADGMAIDYSHWSTDKRAVQDLRNDSLVAPGDVTAGTARALLAASDELQKRIGEITVPLLILDGEQDEVSDHQAIVALAGAARAADKTLTVYPGLAYDLFHETQRDQVVSDVVEWLQKRAESAPPPPPTVQRTP